MILNIRGSSCCQSFSMTRDEVKRAQVYYRIARQMGLALTATPSVGVDETGRVDGVDRSGVSVWAVVAVSVGHHRCILSNCRPVAGG